MAKVDKGLVLSFRAVVDGNCQVRQAVTARADLSTPECQPVAFRIPAQEIPIEERDPGLDVPGAKAFDRLWGIGESVDQGFKVALLLSKPLAPPNQAGRIGRASVIGQV